MKKIILTLSLLVLITIILSCSNDEKGLFHETNKVISSTSSQVRVVSKYTKVHNRISKYEYGPYVGSYDLILTKEIKEVNSSSYINFLSNHPYGFQLKISEDNNLEKELAYTFSNEEELVKYKDFFIFDSENKIGLSLRNSTLSNEILCKDVDGKTLWIIELVNGIVLNEIADNNVFVFNNQHFYVINFFTGELRNHFQVYDNIEIINAFISGNKIWLHCKEIFNDRNFLFSVNFTNSQCEALNIDNLLYYFAYDSTKLLVATDDKFYLINTITNKLINSIENDNSKFKIINSNISESNDSFLMLKNIIEDSIEVISVNDIAKKTKIPTHLLAPYYTNSNIYLTPNEKSYFMQLENSIVGFDPITGKYIWAINKNMLGNNPRPLLIHKNNIVIIDDVSIKVFKSK